MRFNKVFVFILIIVISNLVSCSKKTEDKVRGRFLASTPSENLICEDLFSAACLNSDGTLKDPFAEVRAETNEVIELAQNRALEAMGYSSLEEAYLDRMQKAGGFEVGPQENGASYNLGLGVSSCEESPISGNNQSRHVGIVSNYYSQNLDEFIFQIANICRDNSISSAAGNVQSLCAEQLRLRTEISNIYRLSHEEKKQRARDFVNQNISILQFGESRPENNLCFLAEFIQNIRLDEIDTNLRKEIQTSRPFVETMIDHFYSPENIRRANAQFANSRAQLQSIYNEINPNSPNAEVFQTSLNNLRLQTLQRPSDSDYVRNVNGTLVLKDNLGAVEGYEETYHSIFSDLTLNFFREPNGMYLTPAEISSELINYNDLGHISMRPALWATLQNNPMIFNSILSHETGHKFSPSVSNYEGFGDINHKFNDIFICFGQSESINMTDSMKNEVIADYVAAEMLARQLSIETDINKRRESLIKSVSHFCGFESEMLNYGVFSDPNQYPAINHRCSGIFGANPNIRNLIGCEGESPNYKSCGLNLSLGVGVAPATQDSNEGGVE